MFTNMINVPEWKSWMVVLGIWLAIWDLVRKAIALYKAWQKNNLIWFIFIFIFNTCGILPIIYLILNREKTDKIL